MGNSSPAFQFYPGDWLRSLRVTMMTHEEQGIYMRLLCYCWLNGSIPKNTKQLKSLVGGRCKQQSIEKVKEMFTQDPSHTESLVHDRLESERIKQADFRVKRSKAGKKSAERFKRMNNTCSTSEQQADNSSSSSSDRNGVVENGNYKPVKELNQ
ncbi:MAG: DUF1376 domain-containing protein [Bacteroidetes bacterium]|nr:DUF1376 domain-containing protein [Bacteroidota bacterium]